MTTTIRLLALCAVLSASPLNAETLRASSGPNVTPVVELYTSEGCSSCPPADDWLAQLAQLPASSLDVAPLAFHVDYWDYIGWKDRFADPRFTLRQRQLARSNRQSTIYTPGFYVAGKEGKGSSRMIENIRTANNTEAQVDLELEADLNQQQLALRLNSVNRSDRSLQVEFVVFENNLHSQVTRGENTGRELLHQRVVRHLSKPMPLFPGIEHRVDVKTDWKPADLGVVALVRSADNQFLQSVQLAF